ALTQKVFANMRRIGKGFSGVHTPLFDGMLVQQQVQVVEDATEDEDDYNEVSAKPTPPSSTPITPPPSPTQEHIPSLPQDQTAQPSSPPPQQPSQTADISQSAMTLLNTLLETCNTLTKQVSNLEQYKIAQAIEITKLKQRVVTTTAATTITAAQVPKASAPRNRRGVVIQDPKETATASIIVHFEEELHQFDRLEVWELVDRPLCTNVINLKWLWKNKRDEENTVIRNKSRLVAKGYAQKEGVDLKNLSHLLLDDSASGKEIPFDTLHSGANVEQSLKLIMFKTSRKYAKGLLLLVEDLMLLVQVKAIR
nr:Gag-Pol polyprotein [Tanacetum cinerariifolium]